MQLVLACGVAAVEVCMLRSAARPHRRDEAKKITTGCIHWLSDRQGRTPPLRFYLATLVHLSQDTFPYRPRPQAPVVPHIFLPAA
jgi:hypothetical protein